MCLLLSSILSSFYFASKQESLGYTLTGISATLFRAFAESMFGRHTKSRIS